MLASLGRGLARAVGTHVAAGDASAPLAAAWRANRSWQPQRQQQQTYSSGGEGVDAQSVKGGAAGHNASAQEVQAINDAFAEAREDLADARDDAETVYFNESAAIAAKSVEEVLQKWQGLLGRLPEQQRGELMRSMGLKMEQLKAELKELDDLHD